MKIIENKILIMNHDERTKKNKEKEDKDDESSKKT